MDRCAIAAARSHAGGEAKMLAAAGLPPASPILTRTSMTALLRMREGGRPAASREPHGGPLEECAPVHWFFFVAARQP